MLSKSEVNEVVNKVREALKSIPNVQFDLSSIKYGPNFVQAKLVCTVGSEEEKQELDKKNFLADAKILGFTNLNLYSEFKFNGDIYQITGINLRRWKFPVSAKNTQTGKSFRFSAATVQSGLNLMKPKRPVEDILKDLRKVYLDMSPENLTCDGELTKEQSDRRYRLLKGEEARLIGELGRFPTEDELK